MHESGNISPFQVNGGPMCLELVAIAVGQDFNFFFPLRLDQQLVTAKTCLGTTIKLPELVRI